ncbi:MAG: glycosyltransferase [Acidimicrobiales bacterium]
MPDPARGGGWAVEYELLRHASAHHDILLLSAGQEGPVPPEVASLPIEVQRVRWEPMPRPRNRPAMLWRSLTQPMGIVGGLMVPCSRALAEAVVRLEREQHFDLVHVWPGDMAEVASVTRAPSAVFCTDVHTRQRERERDHATTRRQRFFTAVELRKVRAWETAVYCHASALAAVTAIDAAVLEALTHRRADVVPLMIGDEWFDTPTCDRDRDVVTMIAALDYKPNVDAAIWLADEIWPDVVAARPASRLRIVGRNPTDDVRQAAARAGAELLADVPDVRPYYWSAAAVIAPIRLGSGMRNKILHAAASGSPQVATSTAIEGIELHPGDDLLVADDASDFAQAVVATLDDPIAAQQRATRSAAAVLRYQTQEVGSAFMRFWDRAAARPDDPTITLIVVNFGSSAQTERLVDGIADDLFEVVIVDNPVDHLSDRSELDMLDALAARYTNVRVVALDDNVGYGAGANAGAADAAGDVLVIANPDVEVDLTSLRCIATAAYGRGVAGPRFTNPDGTLQRSAYRRDPGLLITAYDLCPPISGLLRRARPDWHPTAYSTPDHERPLRCRHVLGALLAIDAKAFRSVDGFDEEFFLYREETDLCHRLLEAGWQVLYEPTATATHTSGGTTTDPWPQAARPALLASHYRFIAKHRGRGAATTARILGTIGALVWMLRLREPRAALRSLRWHLGLRPR